MTAQFIGARVPVCDPDTGVANPIWYRLFQQLFDISGVGSVDDAEAASIAPVSDQAVFLSIANGRADDLAPVAPIYVTILDDLSPSYAVLQSQIADLRAQIDDLRKGLTA